ncbi:MAG TPA: glycosyltransferase family 39 protein [Chthoniobacter sp.]|nr:glycosyltransferase family 39 protein [Chthoniobacter sp.]
MSIPPAPVQHLEKMPIRLVPWELRRSWVFLFLVVITILRWLYAGAIELSPDEAYYQMWSQRLDLAYISKGPGVALAIRFGTALFGVNEFGVRFLSPLLALGTSLLVFFLARRIERSRADDAAGDSIAEQVAIWTVIAMQAIPILQVGALVMTIDPLSIFFWAAGLGTFWLALERSPRFSIYWPLTGLCIGLGFLSKYTNAMQLLSIVLLLATNRKYRGHLARSGFWSLLLVFALCALPPVLWNQRHDWITVGQLKVRGHLDHPFGIHPLEWLSFFGAQLGVYSPLLFVAMLIALWWSRHEARESFQTQFLLWFALPLLVMYAVLALNKAGQPNWTAPAFVSLGILATASWYKAARTDRKKVIFALGALVVGAFMGLGITRMDMTWKLTSPGRSLLAQLPLPDPSQPKWLRDTLSGCHKFSAPYPYNFDPSARLHGWNAVARAVDQSRQAFEQQAGQKVFLIANSYSTAAEIAFYLPEKRVEYPGHPPVYLPESPVFENQFAFWPRYDTTGDDRNPFTGRTALYITDRPEEEAPASLTDNFAQTERIAVYEVRQNGGLLRTLRVFVCRNYRVQP